MSYEDVGSGYDSGASGHELAGRHRKPVVATEHELAFHARIRASARMLNERDLYDRADRWQRSYP